MRLPAPRRARRPGLTALIDVVFLLLVFFMLASRFGLPAAVPVAVAGGGAWEGPPRLVTVLPEGMLVNGAPAADPAAALAPLMPAGGGPVLVRAAPEVHLQRLVDAVEALRSGGIALLAVVP